MELRINNNNEDVVDLGVSVDGSWQLREFSSLNGVVATISRQQDKTIFIS